MAIHQQIRFSVEPAAIDDVKYLIESYAGYVSQYAEQHEEVWTWVTYQDTQTPTDFVSVISHEDPEAETRHRQAEGTKIFAENLYKHVTDNEVISYRKVASSTKHKLIRRSDDDARSTFSQRI